MVWLSRPWRHHLACRGGCAAGVDGQGQRWLGWISCTLRPGAVSDGSSEVTSSGATDGSRLQLHGTDGCCSGSSTALEGWSGGEGREEA